MRGYTYAHLYPQASVFVNFACVPLSVMTVFAMSAIVDFHGASLAPTPLWLYGL